VKRLTQGNDNDNDRAKDSRTGIPSREQKKKRKMTMLAPYTDAVSSRRGRESLSPAVQARIGQGLKAIFDEIAREPIPHDLLRLLEKLESDDGKKTK